MSLIVAERQPPLAIVTLNRPEAHNALSHELVLELTTVLKDLDSAESIRCLIVTGAGDEAFSAGADMKQMADASAEELGRMLADTRRLFRSVANFTAPTLAAVNGHAHGGGAEIACACDLRIGSPRTTFRFPGVTYGMAVGTWHLPTLVGLPKAKELLFTGEEIGAEEALRIGLLNRLGDEGDLLQRACTLGRHIAAQPAEALAVTKSLLNGSEGAPLQQRFFRELYSNQELGVNQHLKERLQALLEAEPPANSHSTKD